MFLNINAYLSRYERDRSHGVGLSNWLPLQPGDVSIVGSGDIKPGCLRLLWGLFYFLFVVDR